MDVLTPVMHIAFGVLAYLGFAILALAGVRGVGRDLRASDSGVGGTPQDGPTT